jgi:hypothetical protein
LAFSVSALVNRYCLIDDMEAHDLAVLFGIAQPGPGPYIITRLLCFAISGSICYRAYLWLVDLHIVSD